MEVKAIEGLGKAVDAILVNGRLKTNDISGVAYDGNPLDKLANILPKVDPDLINQRMYGKIIN